jgi:hypothetical protein
MRLQTVTRNKTRHEYLNDDSSHPQRNSKTVPDVAELKNSGWKQRCAAMGLLVSGGPRRL